MKQIFAALLVISLIGFTVAQECGVCLAVAQKLLDEPDKSSMNNLLTACKEVSPYPYMCPVIATSVQLGLQDAQTICQGKCAPVFAANTLKSGVQSGATCTICQTVVKYAESYVTSSTTQQELEQILEKGCSYLGPFSSACDSAISAYLPVLLQMLINKEDPTTVCQQIKLCSSSRVTATAPVTAPAAPVTAPAAPKSFATCTACNLIFAAIDSFVSSTATEQEIEQILDKACDKLPSFIRSSCSNIVTQYYPLVVQLLVSKASPQSICTAIKACSTPKRTTLKGSSSSTGCQICQTLTNVLSALLSSSSTDEEITHVLENVCKLLPSSLNPQCEAAVSQYAPLIITLVAQGELPKLCQQIRACTVSAAPGALAKSFVGCAACKAVAFVVGRLVNSDSNRQHIIQSVQKVCTHVPQYAQSYCYGIVSSYGPEMVQLILTGSLGKMCTVIKAC